MSGKPNRKPQQREREKQELKAMEQQAEISRQQQQFDQWVCANADRGACRNCGNQAFLPTLRFYNVPAVASPTGQPITYQKAGAFLCAQCNAPHTLDQMVPVPVLTGAEKERLQAAAEGLGGEEQPALADGNRTSKREYCGTSCPTCGLGQFITEGGKACAGGHTFPEG